MSGKNFSSYSEEAQKPLLIAMIESVQAINNLNEILKVEGLDAVFIGPYDLSASMGLTGQFDNKKFQDSIKEIKNKSNEAKIPSGLHVVESSRKKLDKALKRNLEGQAKPVPTTTKSSSNDLTVEEPLTENDEALEE